MSFLNTIRGLGRGSKKNKKDLEPTQPSLYSHSNLSGNNLRRTQSPTKGSPTKLSARSAAGTNHYTSSPTKRNKLGISQQQQQQQQQQQLQQFTQQQQQSTLPLKRSTIQTLSNDVVNAEPPLFYASHMLSRPWSKVHSRRLFNSRNMLIILNGWRLIFLNFSII